MIFRNLDSDGDFEFGRGKGCYARKDDAIKLNIKTRLQSWLKDCFFAMNEGIDWYNRLGSKSQRTLLEQDIKRIITQSDGVVDLVSFWTSLDGRSFSAEYSIKTIYSPSINDTIEIGV